jgi:hypothetical protein
VFFVFLIVVAAAGIAFYLVLIMREVPGAAEERFGRLEELPEDLGKWHVDEESPEGASARSRGLRREERLWLSEKSGFFSGQRLLRQVRYRSAETNEIVRTEPDQVVKRKRIRS